MKAFVPYILIIILSLFLIGCKDNYDDRLEPSLLPKLTIPTEALIDVSFSEFPSDKDWDNTGNDSPNIDLGDFGAEHDWDNTGDSDSDFNLGSWSDDTNWNN